MDRITERVTFGDDAFPNGIRTNLSVSLPISLSLCGFHCIVEHTLDSELLALAAPTWYTMTIARRTPDKGEVDGQIHLGRLVVSLQHGTS